MCSREVELFGDALHGRAKLRCKLVASLHFGIVEQLSMCTSRHSPCIATE